MSIDAQIFVTTLGPIVTPENSDRLAAVGPRKAGLGRQFSGVVVSRMLGAILQAGVGIALARSVAPAEYGVIVAFTGLVVFLLVVADLGVSSYIGQARARQSHPEVSAALRVNTVSAATIGVLCGVGALVAGAERPDLAGALLLVACGQAVEKNVECTLAVFIADREIRVPALSVLVRRASLVAVFVALVWLSVAAVPAYGAAVFVGAVVGRLHIQFGLRRLRLRRNAGDSVLDVLRSSFPFAVNDASIQSRGLDVAVVSWAVGAFTGGLYAAAAKLITPFNLIASTLAAVVLPHSTTSSRVQARKLVDLLLLVALVGSAIAAVPAFLAEEVLRSVVGDDYVAAAGCLAVMLLSLPMTLVATPLDAVLQGRGRSATVARISAAASVLLLTAVGVGGLVAGAMGAAVGFAAVSLTKTFLLYLIARSSTRETML